MIWVGVTYGAIRLVKTGGAWLTAFCDDVLRAKIYDRLIDRVESAKNGQEPVLYSPDDVMLMPDASEVH